MNKYFTLLLLFCGILSHAQQISFTYDGAGNQKTRSLCLTGCTAKKTNVETKEVEALVSEDLQKFFPEDVISYYPNPVKEELYLRWETINDNSVASIKVYDLSGRVIDSYTNLDNTNNQNIFFQRFPKGIYILVLVYNDKEEKSIKIIKE